MPKIIEEKRFDGAEGIIERLGFEELLDEVREIVTGFELLLLEKTDANGAGALRKLIDLRFANSFGWKQRKTGGVDWIKKQAINGRPRHISIGVELQVSGRSDMVAVDLIHLRNQLLQGAIDLAVLIVPSDLMGKILTDRVATWTQTMRHIGMSRAEDMPFILMSIEHDGPSDRPLKKLTYKSKAAEHDQGE